MAGWPPERKLEFVRKGIDELTCKENHFPRSPEWPAGRQSEKSNFLERKLVNVHVGKIPPPSPQNGRLASQKSFPLLVLYPKTSPIFGFGKEPQVRHSGRPSLHCNKEFCIRLPGGMFD